MVSQRALSTVDKDNDTGSSLVRARWVYLEMKAIIGAFRALLLRDAFENYRGLESRFVIACDVTKLFLSG